MITPRPSRLWRATLRRALAAIAAAAALLVVLGPAASAEPEDAPSEGRRVIEILPVDGFLDPPVAAAITDVIAEAEARGSELVVIELSAPGAASVDVEALARTVADATVPVAFLVGPPAIGAEAAGGAAAVVLAADVIALAVDATVGPVVPLTVGEDTDPAAVADAVAARLGLAAPDPIRPLVGEERWDVERLRSVVAGVEGPAPLVLDAPGLQPLLVELDGRTVTTVPGGPRELVIRADEVDVRFHSLGLIRRMLHAATTPEFIYLLVTIGLALLLFEVFQPGFGVAGIAGVITAAVGVFGLTVLPVTWWAVALTVLGLLLYAVDVAIAGFGALTLAATASFAAGSWWFYADGSLALPAWLVVGTTIAAFVFFVVVMTTVLRAQAGPDTEAVDSLIGRVGTVRSVLNPEGHVYIDGALWRARWTGEGRRVKVGTPVEVHAVDGPMILVHAFDPQTREATPADARS